MAFARVETSVASKVNLERVCVVPKSPVESWGSQEIVTWLEATNMSAYDAVFVEFTGEHLVALNDNDLAIMSSRAHIPVLKREQILKNIRELI